MGELTTKANSYIKDIPAPEWDRCAGGDNPFTRHAFLLALEVSGSATAEEGWLGRHLTVWDGGEMNAALPLYLKSHSMGEYVFDHSWADAYTRAGGSYYPKLQSSIPFTPATASKFLIKEGEDKAVYNSHLIGGLNSITKDTCASSLHLTFLPECEARKLEENNFLIRCDQQFHWENENYKHFDDFSSSLSSRKRKSINRERREALKNGIEIEILTGTNILELHWDHFYEFYQDTGARKWGQPYLTREFFSHISASMADKIVLMMAKREGNYIAGALNFLGADTLYGRNWGASEHHPFLHFELCYYQAIDFAIERGLKWVEAGAQGQHKLSRGYLPRKTYSAHYIPNIGFRDAIEHYLIHERENVNYAIKHLNQFSPFKKN